MQIYLKTDNHHLIEISFHTMCHLSLDVPFNCFRDSSLSMIQIVEFESTFYQSKSSGLEINEL